MKQHVQTGLSVTAIVSAVGLLTAIFTLDDRYMKDANAGEYHLKEAIDREVGDVDTQIKLLVLEIEWLSSIPEEDRDTSQNTRLEILKLQLSALLQRQGDLAKGE